MKTSRKVYKLVALLFLLISVATLLVGCGGDVTPATRPATTTTVATTSDDARSAPVTTLKGGKIGQPVSQGDYILTVNAAEKSAKVSHDNVAVPLSSGKIFVNIDLTVISNGDLAFSNPSYVKIKDSKGGLYENLLLGKTPALPIETSLPKGSQKRGWITLEVPQDSTGLVFQYKPQSLDNMVISIPLEDNAVVEAATVATTTAAALTTTATTTVAVAKPTTATTVATSVPTPSVAPVGSTNSSDFKEFVSKEGGFSILLPGTPQENKQNAGDAANPFYLYYYSARVSKNLLYFASYIDYSDEVVSNRPPEEILKGVQNGSVTRAATNKLVSEKTLQVQGLPAREYEYTDESQVSYLTRSFLNGKRLYQMGATYTVDAKPSATDLDRFFNSIKLSNVSVSTPVATTSQPLAPVKLDGYIFTVNKVEKPTTVDLLGSPSKPKAGNYYLTLDITIGSEKAENVDANTLYATIVDNAGNKYNAALIGREPELPTQNDIPAGQQLRGWLTFELPLGATNLTLVYSPISIDDTIIKVPLGN